MQDKIFISEKLIIMRLQKNNFFNLLSSKQKNYREIYISSGIK